MRRKIFFLSFGLFICFFAGAHAMASTIVVDTVTDEINDPGPDTGCSLREAIQAANTDTAYGGCTAGSGSDIIAFDPSTDVGSGGPIAITIAGAAEDLNQTGDFDITTSMAFQGNGPTLTVIDGGALDRVFHVVTNTGLTVNFYDMRVTNGNSGGNGGGGIFIRGNETSTMNNVRVDSSVSGAAGGGIYSDSATSLTLIDSRVDGNTATTNGGGIFSNGGAGAALNLDNTSVDTNLADTGGGIYGTSVMNMYSGAIVTGNDATTRAGGIYTANYLAIDGSDVTLNDALADEAGGIFNSGGGNDLTIFNGSLIDGNTAATIGGGIYNSSGTLSIVHSTVNGNTAGSNGGGIVNGGAGAATGSVSQSAVTNNIAGGDGGGISNQNNVSLQVYNSTISGNTATGDGGGIVSYSLAPTLTISSSTIANNSATGSGDGLFVDGGTASTVNSIFDQTVNCAGSVALTSNGYNIDSGNTCSFANTGDQVNTDPLLGALALNAPGLTQTHALLAGSPAINAGDSIFSADQRGFSRPDGIADDIGSYEYDVVPVLTEVTPVPNPTSTDVPDYTFSSTDAGTIAYGGSCSSLTHLAVAGTNTIKLEALALGLHDDCTITVTDAESNVSNVLTITAFEFCPTCSGSSGGGTAGGRPEGYVWQEDKPNNPSPLPEEPEEDTVAPPAAHFISSFTDIAGHWAESYITTLEETCSLTGYLDANGEPLGLFMPDSKISRAELLTMLIKCKYGVLPSVTSAPFPDVAASHWAAQYIAKASELGVVSGYDDGTFRPDALATRGEALKMILLTYLDSPDVPAASPASCTDIDPAAWYAPYFNYAMEQGIVSGYKDSNGNLTGLCGPGNDVTRAESAKMIVTAGGL